MQRIKKGDEVIVTAGKDKGRRGPVTEMLGDRVMIESINMVKKHVKPNPMAGVEGGIIEKEMSIHISNIMIFNPATNKGDRVGIKTLDGGKKVRFYKSNNEVIDV